MVFRTHAAGGAMNKLLSLGLGLLLGATVGAVLVVLFSPQSGPALREHLRESARETLDEARKAGQARRAELEAELAGLPRTPSQNGR
jgi:gas vesicle protein